MTAKMAADEAAKVIFTYEDIAQRAADARGLPPRGDVGVYLVTPDTYDRLRKAGFEDRKLRRRVVEKIVYTITIGHGQPEWSPILLHGTAVDLDDMEALKAAAVIVDDQTPVLPAFALAALARGERAYIPWQDLKLEPMRRVEEVLRDGHFADPDFIQRHAQMIGLDPDPSGLYWIQPKDEPALVQAWRRQIEAFKDKLK